jgi:hypothetical protein
LNLVKWNLSMWCGVYYTAATTTHGSSGAY